MATPKECGQHTIINPDLCMQEHCITVSKLDTHFLQLVSFIYGYLGWQKTASGLGSEKSNLKF